MSIGVEDNDSCDACEGSTCDCNDPGPDPCMCDAEG